MIGRRRGAIAAVVAAAVLLQSEGRTAPPPLTGRTWSAAWIWDRPLQVERNVYSYFRKEFSLDASPVSATGWITADSRYQLLVNGRFVGRGPVRSDPRIQFYDTYDLRHYLQAGVNVIGIIVHVYGDGNEQYMFGAGGVIFESAIKVDGGVDVAISTDATWQAMRSSAWDPASARESDGQGFVEVFDARRDPVGWLQGGFDASLWTAPHVVGPPPAGPWGTLLARDIPLMFEGPANVVRIVAAGEVQRAAGQFPGQLQAEVISPASTVSIVNPEFLLSRTGATHLRTTQTGRDAAILLDFGRVISGFPYLDLSGVEGAIVDVSFSEWLDEGQIVTTRGPARFCDIVGKPFHTADRVILRNGPMRWQRFFPSSFRYLQLTIRDAPQPVSVNAVGAVFTSYPFAMRGWFRSSDDTLNRIWSAGVYTVLLSTYDVFMDSPWRERAQWMDMVTPVVSHSVFGEQAIAARFLRSTALSQNAQGRMFFPYPSWFSFELPDQTMWWGMQLWQYYLHFGDAELVRQLYPVLNRANNWFQSHLSPRGTLLADWPDDGGHILWPWIDHGHRVGANAPCDKRGEMAALDALYYKFLIDAANVARAVNRPDDAARFDQQARQLKDAINETYWDGAAGFYWDDPARTIVGEQASVLAVLYGISLPGEASRILENVIDDQEAVGSSQPHFYVFVLDALARGGMYERAVNMIRLHWKRMLDQGATSLWEVWNPELDFFGQPWPEGERHHFSMAHGYSAAPTVFLTTLALGVRPIAPAFSRFLVAPNTEGLDWVDGGVPTPTGLIKVAWRKTDIFTLRLSGPLDVPAVVSLPKMPNNEVFVDGTLVWRGTPQTPGLATIRVSGATPTRVVLDVQPGSYVFVSR